ncbi:MAG: NTP transferase domain-containing protein [Phycisphaerae bacterium]|nr:NTP transferase domain-containing protein [Phycisphaerae bacterium]
MGKTKNLLSETAVAILCGGRGTRMRSADRHKVCFPIDGVPAIVRTLRMFHRLGVRRMVLVVGAMAENVIATVSREFPHVLYVYQGEQLGTGHAAQIAAEALRNLDHRGPILITAGDKVIQPHVIHELAEEYLRSRSDMAFVTSAKRQGGQVSTAGRIMTNGVGRILGNVELRDIQRGRVVEALLKQAGRRPSAQFSYQQIIRAGRQHIADEGKLAKALGPAGQAIKEAGSVTGRKLIELFGPHGGSLSLGGKRLAADQIERQSKTVNLSVYLGGSEFWYRFLPVLSNENAQREYYLTDAIQLVAEASDRTWKLSQHKLSDPSDVMAFNSPDELLIVEDTLRRMAMSEKDEAPGVLSAAVAKLPAGSYRPAGKWLELFESWPAGLNRRFAEIYGPDAGLIHDRRKLFVRAIKLFICRFGVERKAIVVRAPGRINLLGRHVDHRGGAVNVMAIDRDVVFVTAPREDDTVTLCNDKPQQFPDREFSLRELLGDIEWQDWLSYVNSDHVRSILSRTQGDWSNYVKASMVRLQQQFTTIRIAGFDAAVAGDIPMAAGLSSSSAMVVASAEAAVAFNGLNVNPTELVDLCGEGEWFVGSRGGAADHTAISMGRRGQLAHVRFLPFQIEKIYDFPSDCRVIIAHSGIDAKKSATAKDKFNQKVASYELSLMLLKDRVPQLDHLLAHVRDINPRRLHCPISQIYRHLLTVPEYMPAKTIRETLSERHQPRLERVFGSHRNPECYDLRGVLLYGIAECERSLLAPELLEQGRTAEFGRLMRVSHDGDRVASHRKSSNGRWRTSRFRYDCGDPALARLCEDLASENPQRVLAAQLYMQGGAYECSTPQIDKMIDAVRPIDGVHGAQLGGAGLGGCIMILARPDAVAGVVETLKREYYSQMKSDPFIHVCQPVAGSGLIAV